MEDKPIVLIENLSQQPSLPPQAAVVISVENPQQEDSHFTYQIVGTDREGPFNIRRRYSDFDLLRKKLCQRWLGVYIPPISGKRSDKNPLYFLKFL